MGVDAAPGLLAKLPLDQSGYTAGEFGGVEPPSDLAARILERLSVLMIDFASSS